MLRSATPAIGHRPAATAGWTSRCLAIRRPRSRCSPPCAWSAPNTFARCVSACRGAADRRSDTARRQRRGEPHVRLPVSGRPAARAAAESRPGKRPRAEVVGVVDDMRQGSNVDGPSSMFGGVLDPPLPEMFLPTSPVAVFQSTDLIVVIRTRPTRRSWPTSCGPSFATRTRRSQSIRS